MSEELMRSFIEHMDTDSNGTISLAEFSHAAEEFLAKEQQADAKAAPMVTARAQESLKLEMREQAAAEKNAWKTIFERTGNDPKKLRRALSTMIDSCGAVSSADEAPALDVVGLKEGLKVRHGCGMNYTKLLIKSTYVRIFSICAVSAVVRHCNA